MAATATPPAAVLSSKWAAVSASTCMPTRSAHRTERIGKHPIPQRSYAISVASMTVPVPCFLVEWYHSTVTEEPLDHTAARLSECAVSMSAQGSPIRLLNLLAVPTDEVLFAVFTADSANVVSQTCDRAGIPAQRVTTATEVDLEGRL